MGCWKLITRPIVSAACDFYQHYWPSAHNPLSATHIAAYDQHVALPLTETAESNSRNTEPHPRLWFINEQNAISLIVRYPSSPFISTLDRCAFIVCCTWDSCCGWEGCSDWSTCATAELWDICDKLKPWLIRSNHEKGVPGFTTVGGLPSNQLIRLEGEVDGLSESWRHSGSYYHGGHSVHAPRMFSGVAWLLNALRAKLHNK